MLREKVVRQIQKRTWCWIFAMMAWAGGACAQDFRGSLLVTAEDSSGGRIAGAAVTLRQEKSGAMRDAKADTRGEARFDALQPGTYSVTISANGFEEKTARVSVGVSSQPAVAIALEPRGLRESVQVRDRGPSLASEPIETTSSTIQTQITAEDLDEIPLSARSFANISLMAPFTEPVEPSDPTKARITAVSFGGSSGLNVDLSVDGGDNNDDYIGGFLQNFSPEAIQEFVVRTAQFGADTSRTNGGSVILSTRSGTNDWQGSLSYFYRGKNLNARNTLDNPEPDPKQPFSRQNGVATFGGPIRRGKLWFFSSYEYVDETPSVAYSANSQRQFAALGQLAGAGLIPGVSSLGTIPSSVEAPFRDTLFSTRVDWTQSARSQWFVRGTLDRNHTQNDLVQQGALPSTGFTTTSNYYNILVNQQFQFTPEWHGSFTGETTGFHHVKVRNSNLGIALAFPFTASSLTTSGLETFGDNQFQTAITAFPVARNQQKYQFRYDVSRASARHAMRFGVNVIHEPVLRGALSATQEHFVQFTENPTFYTNNPVQFTADFVCSVSALTNTVCTDAPAGDGTFSQSLRRVGFYGEDDWRATPSFTVNAGLRYDTTFGLFIASGRDQRQNPAFTALQGLGIHLADGIPHDYRGAVAPRLGIAYAPGGSTRSVIRAGAGLFYNDLAQNGWVGAFQAVNNGNASTGLAPGAQGALIDPKYKTPYALQASLGVEHEFDKGWRLNVSYEHQEGNHQYRAYDYVAGFTLPANAPNLFLFRSDNRSSYNGLALQVQHSFAHRFELTANYVLAHATTWGAVAGELFDYVNRVSNVNNPFGPGDHGPSGEDVRHRFVVIGVLQLPWRFEVSTISQFESARPFTLSTPADVNNDGVFGSAGGNDRAVINGVQTSLDEFRGTPFYQVDLRVSLNINLGERFTLRPFAEFFNAFNRLNPGNNYVTDISALPTPVNNPANATAFCVNADCSQTKPITSINQLKMPAGALGDFFGPGTTVGIPFAAQVGLKLTF